MCHETSPAHPMQCILPPHMVEAVRMRGDAKMRKMCDALEREADHTSDFYVSTLQEMASGYNA